MQCFMVEVDGDVYYVNYDEVVDDMVGEEQDASAAWGDEYVVPPVDQLNEEAAEYLEDNIRFGSDYASVSITLLTDCPEGQTVISFSDFMDIV